MVHRSAAGNFSPVSDDSRRNKARVKPELAEFAGEEEERLENRGFPLSKRPRFDSSDQKLCDLLGNSVNGYSPLQEPSPLGLKLKKTPSFLDLIQMKLCQERSSPLAMSLPNRERKQPKSAGPAVDSKLKASNFPATLIKIGTWEYESTHEGDLMAKFYFAKHKLVWEVLDGGLKNKIEIQWSDITSIKATYCGDGPETLDVVVGERPLFFRENNPQPRKHTVWKESTDFTGGQALAYRSDISADSGIMGSQAVKKEETFEGLEILDQIKLPSIHPSMSQSDLAGHIGKCISEQLTSSGNHGLQLHEEADKKGILEDIAEYLLSDSQVLPVSEEKSLMSRVNSLCSFLQKEVPSYTNLQTSSEESKPSLALLAPDIPNSNPDPNGESEALGMSRKDSVGELLLYLPRIASLPHFLNNIGEGED